MRKNIGGVLGMFLFPLVARAGVDQPMNEIEYGDGGVLPVFVALAIVAWLIKLASEGGFGQFLKELAKGLAFIASIYLAASVMFACICIPGYFLRKAGFNGGLLLLLSIPAGLFIFFKLFDFYQKIYPGKPPAE
jgi:hypothetical protein